MIADRPIRWAWLLFVTVCLVFRDTRALPETTSTERAVLQLPGTGTTEQQLLDMLAAFQGDLCLSGAWRYEFERLFPSGKRREIELVADRILSTLKPRYPVIDRVKVLFLNTRNTTDIIGRDYQYQHPIAQKLLAEARETSASANESEVFRWTRRSYFPSTEVSFKTTKGKEVRGYVCYTIGVYDPTDEGIGEYRQILVLLLRFAYRGVWDLDGWYSPDLSRPAALLKQGAD